MIENCTIGIICLPLLSFFINGFLAVTNSRYTKAKDSCCFCSISDIRKLASFIGPFLMFLVALCSCLLFREIILSDFAFEASGSAPARDIFYSKLLYQWIAVGDLHVNFSIYIDKLTAIMFVTINLVSFVVHLYSVGYMHDDTNLSKFMSYISLFTFFMLMLVASDNFLQLFLGWEGVGFCSYLLIGYKNQKESANNAAIKAFITNRVSDAAFIVGMVMIAIMCNSFDFAKIFALNGLSGLNNYAIIELDCLRYLGLEAVISISYIECACLLLFIGCMGKSAQIGLHIWLPDAMEGPTPVSALIHAATMVTAGVFLLARCSYLFELAPQILNLILVIGAITALFAASIAIAQKDIKKIIAYSTCSQLGYMFMACGAGAYQLAVFHLVTHAFFKALLFLCAGNIIHASGEQDIFKISKYQVHSQQNSARSYTNLKSAMKITYAYFVIASLAISGIFPFSGFYSKDLIIESVAASHGCISYILYFIAVITAGLTALYSVKILVLVFCPAKDNKNLDDTSFSVYNATTELGSASNYNNSKAPSVVTVSEVEKVMNLPLIILLIGSIFTGLIGVKIMHMDLLPGYFGMSIYQNHKIFEAMHHLSNAIKFAPTIASIFGALLGFVIYKYSLYNAISRRCRFLLQLLKNKYYFDELYNLLFIKRVFDLSKFLRFIDVKVIDALFPNGASLVTKLFADLTSSIHNGYITSYIFVILASIFAFLTYFIVNFIA